MKTAAAKRHYPTQRALAEAAEVCESAVSRWGLYVPETRARLIASKSTLKFDAGLYERLDKARRKRMQEKRLAARTS